MSWWREISGGAFREVVDSLALSSLRACGEDNGGERGARATSSPVSNGLGTLVNRSSSHATAHSDVNSHIIGVCEAETSPANASVRSPYANDRTGTTWRNNDQRVWRGMEMDVPRRGCRVNVLGNRVCTLLSYGVSNRVFGGGRSALGTGMPSSSASTASNISVPGWNPIAQMTASALMLSSSPRSFRTLISLPCSRSGTTRRTVISSGSSAWNALKNPCVLSSELIYGAS